MKRSLIIIVSILGAALLMGTAVVLRSGPDEIPVYQVGEETFVRRVTAEGTLRAVKSTPVNTPNRARRGLKIATLAPNGSEVRKGDVLVTFDPTEFENELFDGASMFENASNRLDKQGALAGATQKNLTLDAEMAQEEYESASEFARKDAEIFSRADVIEAEIDQDLALQRRDSTGRVLDVREDQASADRQLIEIDQRKAQIRIDQAKDGLDALVIRAPHDGIFVFKPNPWSGEMPEVGQNVWRGFPIGELPDLSEMEAEIFVLEADAGGLAEGVEAEVLVESSPGRVYKGTIKSVEPLAKPRTRGVPVQYFSAIVSIAETDPETMKPGARIRATLILETLENAISIPRQAIFDRKGQSVVFRRDGSEFVAVPVEVGNGTPGSVIVTKGLSAGDVIALENPEANGEGKRR